jgi:zinc transporter ZupT
MSHPCVRAVSVAIVGFEPQPSMIHSMLPYAMGFAAGAMLFVISDEIIRKHIVRDMNEWEATDSSQAWSSYSLWS